MLTQSLVDTGGGSTGGFYGKMGVGTGVNMLNATQKHLIAEIANDLEYDLYYREVSRYATADALTQSMGLPSFATAAKQASKAGLQQIDTMSAILENLGSLVADITYLGLTNIQQPLVLGGIAVLNIVMITILWGLTVLQQPLKNDYAKYERETLSEIQDIALKGGVFRLFSAVDTAIDKMWGKLEISKESRMKINKNNFTFEMIRIILRLLSIILTSTAVFFNTTDKTYALPYTEILKSLDDQFSKLSTSIPKYWSAREDLANVSAYLNIKPKIVDADGASDLDLSEIEDDKPILEFKNVSFDYPPMPDLKSEKKKKKQKDKGEGEDEGDSTSKEKEKTKKQKLLFHNANFVIKKGEHVAIQAESGLGKSSIAALLLREYDVFPSADNTDDHKDVGVDVGDQNDPREDGVYVGGKNVRTDLTQNSLRKNICYVSPNNNEFIPGSIRDHFKLANPYVTDKQIIDTLKELGLWKKVQDRITKMITEKERIAEEKRIAKNKKLAKWIAKRMAKRITKRIAEEKRITEEKRIAERITERIAKMIAKKKGESKSDASNPPDDETILDTKLALRDFFQFSSGEKRRLIIARGLVSEAPIIIWDEPTNALDEASREQVIELIKKKNEGKTAIIISHNKEDVKTLAKSIIPLTKNENKNEDNYGSTIVGKRFPNENSEEKNEEEDKGKIIAKLMKFIVKMKNGQELTDEENAEIEELKKQFLKEGFDGGIAKLTERMEESNSTVKLEIENEREV